ncbi:MAG: efflux RND transporter permease subunit [Gemmataceae bacterium]|nr:efflux RND transporter permease subunit [Gemmataceae bacterium]
MTPSRAVMLFKTEPGAVHVHKREALPWWIFAAAGGGFSLWLAHKLFAGAWGLAADGEDAVQVPRWLWWVTTAGCFLPGALVGGAVGWFSIRPVNLLLGGFFRAFNRGFDWMTGVYGRSVGFILRASVFVLIFYGGLLVLTYWMFNRAPTGFIPQQDQGRLIVNIQLPDSSSLERTKEAAAHVDRITRETEGVSHTVAISGLSFLLQANSPNFASMFVVLEPFDKRRGGHLRDTAIMAKLRKRWASEVKEAQVTVFGASPIPGLGVAGGYKFMVEDRGGLGLQAMQKQTDNLVRQLQAQPDVAAASTQFRSNTPQLYLDIDRSKAAAMGVSLFDVNQTLGMFLGSRYVNSYNQFGRHWQVTVQADGPFRNQIEDISLLEVRNSQGQIVPLGTLVRPREIGGPISITRYNLFTAASISGSVQPGYSTGDAIRTVNEQANQNLPLSMKADWTELMFMQIRAGSGGIYVFALAIVCVFLALAALYESWSLPLAVILVVPLCLLCSLIGVLVTKREVNIFVQIGLVVLVGLACKNAILIVEFARQLQQEGRPGSNGSGGESTLLWATREASSLRLRPILMTSFAFILGVVPLAVAVGAGAEMRRSLGVAVFSGMLGVTLFGIFLTPVFFYVIQLLGKSPMFAATAFQWIGSAALGALLGLTSGFLVNRLGAVRLSWALTIGPCTGVLLVLAVLGAHRTIIRRTRTSIRLQDAPRSNGGLPL